MRVLLLLLLLVVCGPVSPAWADEWRWPLHGDPVVSRPFAAPAHRYAAGHRGADLPSTPGAPVLSAGRGSVSYAGMVAGRGVVVVLHGDLRTTYEPVSALVGVGQPVVAGEVLGTLEPGHAGCAVTACLHWGLRRGDDYLDPVRLVHPGPVRLLPLEGPTSLAALRSAQGPLGAAGGVAASSSGPMLPGAAGGRAVSGDGVQGGGRGGGRGSGADGRDVPGGGDRVLAPAQVETRVPVLAAPYAGVAGMAGVGLLGAAAVGAARRRRG